MLLLVIDLFDRIGPNIKYVVYFFIAVLLGAFIIFYVRPAIILGGELRNIDKKLKIYKKNDDGDVSSLYAYPVDGT